MIFDTSVLKRKKKGRGENDVMLFFLCHESGCTIFLSFIKLLKQWQQKKLSKQDGVKTCISSCCRNVHATRGLNQILPSQSTSIASSDTFCWTHHKLIMKNEDVDGDDSTNTISEDAVLPWVNTTTRQMVTCYAETLKYDPVDDNQFHSKRRKRSNSPKQSPRRKSLVFNETVKVIAIPMRNEYSNQVRSKLWSNPLELQQNAARNAIEFASEG